MRKKSKRQVALEYRDSDNNIKFQHIEAEIGEERTKASDFERNNNVTVQAIHY